MMRQVNLDELPSDLAGFRISSKIEVVQLDGDGQESRTIGYFKDQELVKRILNLVDGNKREARNCTIITNGEIYCSVKETSPL